MDYLNPCRLETRTQSQSDHGELVRCEDGLHGGAELSCCGLRAFNPAAATCCKVDVGSDVRGARICFQGFLKEMERERKTIITDC